METKKITFGSLINNDKPFFKLFLMVIIIITSFLMILRVLFTFIPSEFLTDDNIFVVMVRGKDVDYKILLDWMRNGLFGMYLPPGSYPYGHFYLYHWYFIFWPFYVIPPWISFIIWDLLRISSTIYISYIIFKVTRDKKEIALFFIFCGIGYAVDMYYNNTNWLILFLLVESYIQLERERKMISGLLFTIATFKIYVVIFPLILLVSKKIKFKDLLYYLIPFIILFIPYIVNPSYFFQMVSNWNYSFAPNANIFLRVINTILKLFEPAQLMFISFIVLVFVLNLNNNIVKNIQWKKWILIIAAIGEAILFISFLFFFGIFAVS